MRSRRTSSAPSRWRHVAPLTRACGSKGGKSMATRIRWLGSALGACVIAAVNIAPSARAEKTASPIKHLVVIFQENVSFNHYFGTYPRADNPAGEPQFRAAPDTPSVWAHQRATYRKS